jgi:penicillin-binding protein 2
VGGENGEAPLFTAAPQAAGDMGLSPTVLDVIRDGMCMVTTQDAVGRSSGRPLGTAWFVFDDEEQPYFPAPYTVCGKTGTAQTGRIEPHGWFVAYAPADNPQVAVVVITEFSREGSETSAPIARRMLDAYFGAPNEPFPEWWFTNPYYELQIPQGSTGG